MKLNKRTIVAIFLIIIVAIVMYYQEFREVPVEIPKISVVTAKVDIPENTIIKQDMIQLDDRYIEDVRKEQKIITNKPEDVVGKRTLVKIFQNETIKTTRLLENKPFMDLNDSVEKAEFAFKLDNPEKSYNLEPGSFVDIYIEPNSKGAELLKIPELLFEKKRVFYLKDEKFKPYTKDTKESVPSYVVFNFSKDEILKILSVDEAYYSFRFAAYGENLNSLITGNLVKVEEGAVNNE